MKNKRELTCSYLYTDGTLIQVFDESRSGVQIGSTVDITLGFCKVFIDARPEEHKKVPVTYGRLVMGRYNSPDMITLAKGGRVEGTLPSLYCGSPHSQQKGLRVQYVEITTKNGMRLTWTEIPDVISGQFTVQELKADAMYDESRGVGYTWGYDSRIWKVTDLRVKGLEVAA